MKSISRVLYLVLLVATASCCATNGSARERESVEIQTPDLGAKRFDHFSVLNASQDLVKDFRIELYKTYTPIGAPWFTSSPVDLGPNDRSCKVFDLNDADIKSAVGVGTWVDNGQEKERRTLVRSPGMLYCVEFWFAPDPDMNNDVVIVGSGAEHADRVNGTR